MPLPLSSGVTAALLALTFLVPPLGAMAGPLPILSEDGRQQWQAVGRVNGSGFSKRTGCSGTLIAPDLVVTAAHCTGSGSGVSRHFVAGWYRGQFTAHRVSADITAHPVYGLVEGVEQFKFDVAVIRLSDPIPRGLVSPVPLVAPDWPQAESALLLGYQNSRPHALSGQADCPATQPFPDGLHLFGCEVVSGTSGGAVIVQTEDGPALGGVIVARQGRAGHALTVPVSQWLYTEWRAALAREAARH